jgi:subtilisin family serine protease
MKNYLKLTAALTLSVSSLFVANVIADEESPTRISAIAPNCAAPGEEVSLAGYGFGAQNVMIDVGGETADVLKATGHSAEFLVPSTVLPGFTTVTTVNPGGQEGVIEFQVKGDEICGNNIDDDCDGVIDEVDECPLASIEIDTSPFDLNFSPGEMGNISTTVSFSTTDSTPFTISVTQQIITLSGPDGGIIISPSVGSGFISSSDKATVDNQEISALLDGVYEITTKAEVIETGEIVSSKVRVTVNSVQENLKIGAPGSEPGGLAPNSTTPVTFAAHVQSNKTVPIDVVLGGDVVIILNDQGIDGDIVADDGTFSGTADVDTTGMTSGDCISVTATAMQNSEIATSDTYDLCVTTFPLTLASSNLTNVVIDPVSGEPAVADEVLIIMSPGTTETVISTIANSIGGTVVGSIPGLNTYQLKLTTPVTSSSEFNQLLNDLEAFNEVISAEANVIVRGATVTPTDTQFSSQNGVKKIRADEAWTIARGGVTIAVVDSGADLDHPDLSSKIIKGKDFIDGDFTPEDEHGHGTHVAGIAAAKSNNSAGIAGVSWNSKILVVRVLDSSNGGSIGGVADGIRYAATHAKIINVSIESYGGVANATICNAVSYAINKDSIVIAAAGNKGSSTKSYPAACAGAIAVGNTTPSDTRASDSNYGSWVDLAAPGTNILSTVPKGGTCALCNSSGYNRLSGTSMSAPMVSGAAAVIISREPNAEVETRLKRTAMKLPNTNLGAGRIDLFEAVFNGSFEEGNLALWTRLGTASSKKSLGSIVPQDRDRMGSVSTGPAGTQVSGTLSQSFTIQPGVTSFPISFKYAFVTEEYPEFVGSIFDDSLKIVLVTPAGNSITLAEESVNTSSFTAIGGIDFPGGDTTVGWTGWKSVSQTITVTDGPGTYQIFLQDAGDSVYDTEVLIDEIKFK